MPLLRKQPFERRKPPSDLRPDDDVFHCILTNEIFRTYEEFFERTILCNSLVWSCAFTGKSGLTFAEAQESEKQAEKRLSSLDVSLQKPLLFLVSLTRRGRIADLTDDIFFFAKDRYFIGETVDVVIGREKMTATVIRVVAPARAVSSKANGEVIVIDEDSEPEDDDREPPAANEMMYVVAPLSGKNKRVMVKAVQISRKKGAYTRDRNKLFVKNSCHSVNGVWSVKDQMKGQLGLGTAKFEDFFAGPRPKFEVSESKRKSQGATPSTSNVRGTPNHHPNFVSRPSPQNNTPPGSAGSSSSHATQRQQDRLEKLAKQLAIKKKVEEEKMARQMEMKKKFEEERREKMARQIELRKKFEAERQRMKEERERIRQEKERERVKKLQEKRKEIERQRERNRPRDDLECDDLKPLPEFRELKTKIDSQMIGDALMVLEYVNAFRTVFDFEQFFPKGFTWDLLESALTESDQQGPLCDLLQMLLCTLFNLQESEAGEVQAQSSSQSSRPEAKGDDENCDEDEQTTTDELIRSAGHFAQFSQRTFGMPLRETLLDQFTLTEILRVHIMSSGAHANQTDARFRYQQRGGYSVFDDPGFDLRKQEPALMKKLQVGNVFDLNPDEKLKLVTTLVHQVMSYASVRDILDDSYDKLRVKKYDLKILQWAEVRRIRECQGAVYRRDIQEKVKEQEYRLQEIARAAKIKEAKERGLEPPTFPPTQDPRLTPAQKVERERQEAEEEQSNKAEFEKKDLEAQRHIMELQQTNAIYPLGRDRLYRRYWFFSSLPALLVEDHELFLSFDPHQVTPPRAQDECTGDEALYRAGGKEGACDKDPSSSSAVTCAKVRVCDASVTKDNQEVEKSNDASVSEDVSNDNSVDNVDSNTSVSNDAGVKSDTNAVTENEGCSSGEVPTTEQADTCAQNEQVNGDTQADTPSVNGNDNDSDNNSENNVIKQTTSCSSEWDAANKSKDNETGETLHVKKTVSDNTPDTSQPQSPQADAHIYPSQKEAHWYLVDSPECLQQLMGALNPRGFRESALSAVLTDFKRLLTVTVQDCPVDALCLSMPNVKGASLSNASQSQKAGGATEGDSASEIIELTLRDSLLDLEERMFVGCLGAMQVKDRAAWRSALGNGGYSPLTDEHPFASLNSRRKSKSGGALPEEVVTRDLSHALVQISRGVELRFLKPPLGEAEKRNVNSKDEKSEPQRKAIFDRWEESALAATNLSQVFLHLAALDKSVKWDRSTLKMRCRICRRMRDGDKMLLCDKCDRGHHMYCLKPPLTKVPPGDWFCYTCRPKMPAAAPLKQRRNFDAEEEEEEEEDESMDLDNSSVDDSQEYGEDSGADNSDMDDEPIPNEDVCLKCRQEGELILCDKCPRSYHLHCVEPPLKKVPKGKWLCPVCVADKSKSKKGFKQTPRNSPTPTSSHKKQGLEITPKGQGQKNKNTPKSQDGKKKALTPKGQTPKTNGSATKSTPKGLTNGKSKRRADAEDGDEGELQGVEDILCDLMDHDEAWPFLQPVDKRVVPDYYEVIKKPMDFSTIRNKLSQQAYTSPDALIHDVRLVFANCIEYNLSSAPVYQSGQVLSKLFESRLAQLGLTSLDKSKSSPCSSPKKQRR